MTFTQFWQALQKRNAGLSDPENKMTITVASFERSLKQAYEMGVGSVPKPAKSSTPPYPDPFGDMFR